MIDAHAVGEVVDVADDLVEPGRLEVVQAVLAQERHGEVHADDAARVANRVELRVRQVPGRRAQRMCVRVRRDDGLVADLDDVPEALLVQVRYVDEDPELVACANQGAAGVGQAGTGVGGRRELEGHAFGEGIRTRPDDADRPQPALVPALEVRQIFGDRLGALHVDDRGDFAVAEVGDRLGAAHRERAQRVEELLGDSCCFVERDRRRDRHGIRRRRWIGVERRGDVHREEPSREPDLGGGVQVDVLPRLTAPPFEHEVVVAVDHHV